MSTVMDGIFFFKQKTEYEMRISDWSSDFCSSDLRARLAGSIRRHAPGIVAREVGDAALIHVIVGFRLRRIRHAHCELPPDLLPAAGPAARGARRGADRSGYAGHPAAVRRADRQLRLREARGDDPD